MRSTRTVLLSAALVCLSSAVLGQEPETEQVEEVDGVEEAELIELDPIRCWWRSEKAAVRMGEQFGLVLTCSVVETSALRVVAHTAELEPSAIALIPFEVVGGKTHDDFNEGPLRYFQYEYEVRLLAEDLFGQDVEIPSIPVTYNVQSTLGGGTEGMDQVYLLPALPIRALSLVPAQAADIRDTPSWTFGDMEDQRFRASLTLTLAWIVFGFATLLLLLAMLRGVGHFRSRTPVVHKAPIGRVLSACGRELSALQTESKREGWSTSLLARALALFRIAGAIALDRPISQTVVKGASAADEGQLLVRAGLLRPRRVLVSASTTPVDLGTGLPAGAHEKLTSTIEGLEETLGELGAVRYGREASLNELELDRRLDEGAAHIRRLRSLRRTPRRSLDWLMTAMGGGVAG